MENLKSVKLCGTSIKRVEDPKYMTGRGMYVDDIQISGMLHVAILRSPYAHAKIKNIDISKANKIAGIHMILTGDDLIKDIESLPIGAGEDVQSTPRPALAYREVNYIGEPVALVVAENTYSAYDATDLIEIEYEPLTVVHDPLSSLDNSSIKVHEHLNNNLICKNIFGEENKHVFNKADHVVKIKLVNQRVAPLPMETRGVVVTYEPNGVLKMWISTQGPFLIRDDISKVLKIPTNRIQVIAPDVGGAFGCKITAYPEDILVAYVSKKLQKPIKWIETRRENLLATSHGRDQIDFVDAAVTKKGKILAIRSKIIADLGAYNHPGSTDLAYMTGVMGPGPYISEKYYCEVFNVVTNKVPVDAYRGAGRPEATYLMERIIDRIAKKLNIDPVELRRINFIPKSDFPFRSITGYLYDSGDYKKTLDKAVKTINYSNWRTKQREYRKNNRYIGIGVSSYVEICGFGPGVIVSSSVTIDEFGKIHVISGTLSHGQGHNTTMAQLVADYFQVSIEDVNITCANSSQLSKTACTAGSRAVSVGSMSIFKSAEKIKEKLKDIASHNFEARKEDLIYDDGKIFVKGLPDKSISLNELAQIAYKPNKLPDNIEPGLSAYSSYSPENHTYPFGTHIAIVEIDIITGKTNILEYLAVDDIGNVINPLIVEGQVHGGVIQGISQALLEEIIYDDEGQLLSSSLMDYLIPTAYESPNINSTRTITPSPSNIFGVKGVGEVGTIAATPAIMNAIEDALSPFNLEIDKMPAKPDYILNLLNSSKPK